MDCASSYHIVIKVPNQTGDTLERMFLKHWIQVFGAISDRSADRCWSGPTSKRALPNDMVSGP